MKAARKHDIVYQVGSQQRTEFGGHFRKAVECIRNGRVGKVSKIKIGVGAAGFPCNLLPEKKPDGIDWDMWLGPAPERAFSSVLCPTDVHRHFPQWRRYREYAGGGLSDMGAHHYDIAKWAMDIDETGPVKIIPPKEGSSGLKMIYADGLEIIHESTKDAFNDVVFYGDEGTLYVDRSGITADPKSAVDSPFGGKDWRLPDIGRSHRRNWIDCIRSRKRPWPTSPAPTPASSIASQTMATNSAATSSGRQKYQFEGDRSQHPHRPPRPRRVEIDLMKLT